jgi:outer membrane lipoprotein-sorting protein
MLLLLLLPLIAFGQIASAPIDVQRVLERVAEKYTNLKAFDFEHKVVIEEGQSTVADLTLLSAARIASNATGPINETMCSADCVADTKSPQRHVILMQSGGSAWLYTSDNQEYVTGRGLRSVSGSVSGPTILAMNMLPLMSMDPKQWNTPRLLPDEVLQVGTEKRDCYVLEATLKPGGMPLPQQPGAPPPSPDSMGSTPSMLLGILALQGMTSRSDAFYFQAAANASAPRMRVWVDKQDFVIWKRTVDEPAQRMFAAAQSQADMKPVELHMTDTYTVARTGDAVPASVFQFVPPPGSKERKR